MSRSESPTFDMAIQQDLPPVIIEPVQEIQTEAAVIHTIAAEAEPATRTAFVNPVFVAVPPEDVPVSHVEASGRWYTTAVVRASGGSGTILGQMREIIFRFLAAHPIVNIENVGVAEYKGKPVNTMLLSGHVPGQLNNIVNQFAMVEDNKTYAQLSYKPCVLKLYSSALSTLGMVGLPNHPPDEVVVHERRNGDFPSLITVHDSTFASLAILRRTTTAPAQDEMEEIYSSLLDMGCIPASVMNAVQEGTLEWVRHEPAGVDLSSCSVQ